jgi:dTDP-4-dehydrorhamnose reductase
VKWFITGAGGMVGSALSSELADRGEQVAALSHNDLDVTDSRAVNACVAEHAPDVIVNCAAYTKVDQAEAEESVANAINGSAVELLAFAANQAGSLLVQISTDFVFDGSKRSPYEVTDPTSPLSSYGRSKLLGEIAATHAERHLIVRTSWLFGFRGPNFVEAILNQIRRGTTPLRVVSDQRGRPTYVPHLANAVIRLATADARGMVHYADEDECSWYDFAVAIAGDHPVVPVASDEFPRPAKRPMYSVLSTERYERITGVAPESWREGLSDYLALRA